MTVNKSTGEIWSSPQFPDRLSFASVQSIGWNSSLIKYKQHVAPSENDTNTSPALLQPASPSLRAQHRWSQKRSSRTHSLSTVPQPTAYQSHCSVAFTQQMLFILLQKYRCIWALDEQNGPPQTFKFSCRPINQGGFCQIICMLIGHTKKERASSLVYFLGGRDFGNRGRGTSDVYELLHRFRLINTYCVKFRVF